MDKEDRYAAEAADQVKLALRALDQAHWRFRFCERWRDANRADALLTVIRAAFPDITRDPIDGD